MTDALVSYYMRRMDPLTFAHELRRIRQAAGLSQIEVAACVGVHQTFVSKIERGLKRPYPELVEKWARCCGCRVEIVFASPLDPLDARVRMALPRMTEKQRRALSDLIESLVPPDEG